MPRRVPLVMLLVLLLVVACAAPARDEPQAGAPSTPPTAAPSPSGDGPASGPPELPVIECRTDPEVPADARPLVFSHDPERAVQQQVGEVVLGGLVLAATYRAEAEVERSFEVVVTDDGGEVRAQHRYALPLTAGPVNLTEEHGFTGLVTVPEPGGGLAYWCVTLGGGGGDAGIIR